MKLLRISSFLLLAPIASCALAQNARTTIQSKYDNLAKLSIKRDRKNLEKAMRTNVTSGFEFIDAFQNSLDIEATVRQNTEQIAKVVKFNSNTNKIIGIKQVGKDLVCTVKSSYDALFASKQSKAHFQGVVISEDTWTKTILGWKMRRSKTVKETAMKNGQPFKA